METDPGFNSLTVPFDMAAEETEHEQRLEAAKAELSDEQGLGQQPPNPDVTGILEKYGNDPAKLASAFKSMQAELTRIKQGLAPAQQPQGQPQAPEQGNQAQPPEQVQPPQAGNLTPELVQSMTESLHEAAGGPARFQAIGAWAKTNLPPERLQAYNDAVGAGRIQDSLVHLKAFQYDFTMAQGYEGKLVGGRQPAAAQVRGFSSQGEMTAAMSDPRYDPQGGQFDEGYHQLVHQRLAVSQF